MRDYDDRYDDLLRDRAGTGGGWRDTERTLGRVRRFLASRPAESWWFFAAGLALGALFFG